MLKRCSDLVGLFENYREQLANLRQENNNNEILNVNMCLHRILDESEGPPDPYHIKRYYVEGTAMGQIAAIYTEDNNLASDQYVSIKLDINLKCILILF